MSPRNDDHDQVVRRAEPVSRAIVCLDGSSGDGTAFLQVVLYGLRQPLRQANPPIEPPLVSYPRTMDLPKLSRRTKIGAFKSGRYTPVICLLDLTNKNFLIFFR